MNKDKFLLIKYVKNYIYGLEKMLVTFPKKDILTRNMMYNDALKILELIYKANNELDKDKKHDYQIEAIAKVNMLDFYIDRAYYFKYINEKILSNKSSELLKINKILCAWCLSGR